MRRMVLAALLALVAASAAAQERLTLAVLPFSSVGVSKEDTFGMTLLFETALQATGVIDVVEQTDVGRLIEAQQFAASDLADDSTAVRVGKLLVARQIVLGTAGRIGAQYYLNVKLLDVESGRNLAAEKILADGLDKLVEAIQPAAERLAGADGEASSAAVHGSPTLPVRRTIYTPGGKLNSYYVLSYDADGRVTRSVRFGPAEEVQVCITHEYDAAGNETGRTERDREGKVVRSFSFTYDAAGRHLGAEIHMPPKGQVEMRLRYEYDAAGRLARTSYVSLSGSLFSYYLHQYDPEGREIMKRYYDSSRAILSYETVEYLRSR